ncbi:MAG TPA: hypothetical protein VMF67_14365 [Rhizomicrobium sp.]|nr:hypothetical protein [Rhizomicrobium sp.]
MNIVTDIETIDGQYCFCLREGRRDLALFVFRTEREAKIASDALRQIGEHAVAILPPADSNTDGQSGVKEETADVPDAGETGAATSTVKSESAGTSPFLGR